jgi:hypothetical protein
MTPTPQRPDPARHRSRLAIIRSETTSKSSLDPGRTDRANRQSGTGGRVTASHECVALFRAAASIA